MRIYISICFLHEFSTTSVTHAVPPVHSVINCIYIWYYNTDRSSQFARKFQLPVIKECRFVDEHASGLTIRYFLNEKDCTVL